MHSVPRLRFSPSRYTASIQQAIHLRASLHSKALIDNGDTKQLSPNIAKGQEGKQILEALKPLLLDAGGRWLLTQDGKAIYARFSFKAGFGRTWVSACLYQSEPL